MKALGAAMWTERLRRGWSQREVARRAGFSHTTVHLLEAGKMNPTMSTLQRVFGVLGHRVEFKLNEKQTEYCSNCGSEATHFHSAYTGPFYLCYGCKGAFKLGQASQGVHIASIDDAY